jgi:hypothetical protein
MNSQQRYRELRVLLACDQFDFEVVLRDPRLLGAFLALANLIKELEPQARTGAINFALAGVEIPGFTLVRHGTPGYVETETLAELFSNCPLSRTPALLDAIAKLLGHISGTKYRPLCAVAGIKPVLGAIKRMGATPFLRERTQRTNINKKGN